jgi:hypothetical protein
MANDGIMIATETFAAQVGDEPFMVHKGQTRVRADHQLVKNNPDYFEPVADAVTIGDVEQATAAPGEKRGQRRSRRKATADKTEAPAPADDAAADDTPADEEPAAEETKS